MQQLQGTCNFLHVVLYYETGISWVKPLLTERLIYNNSAVVDGNKTSAAFLLEIMCALHRKNQFYGGRRYKNVR